MSKRNVVTNLAGRPDIPTQPNRPQIVNAKHRPPPASRFADSETATGFSAAEAGDSQSRWSDVQLGDAAKRSSSHDALRDSEARYRRLFETAQDGILILDAKAGSITDVNPFLVKLLGYSRDEFLAMALWDIGLFKDIEASKAAFQELQANQYVRYENLPLMTKGGRSINVEFVSNVYGVNGTKVIQCNIRDITKRKVAEQSEQQLRQTQKMEAVGQLAGGVAHDFNNLLSVILGNCEILRERSDLAETARKMIGDIHDASTTAKDLTRHLLAFSRRQILQPVLLDLNAIVHRIDAMLCRLIGANVRLVSVLQSDLGTIRADPSQIEQVLMNLAVNARDAMPKGGKITIETSNVELDEKSSMWPSAKPRSYVALTVSDTGIGMDDETKSRMFEPFFSTKEAGKGTGLGLSTVFGIVKQSAGMISVASTPGNGTTFTIHFPRCVEAPAVVPQEELKQLLGGSETILLVEDSIPLRELTRKILEDCGYAVLDAGNATDAIRTARRHKGPLPLMITDVVMPGLSGLALADQITATRPETRVLYTSGSVDDTVLQQSVREPGRAFLEKPFTRDVLARKVRELLDASMEPIAGGS